MIAEFGGILEEFVPVSRSIDEWYEGETEKQLEFPSYAETTQKCEEILCYAFQMLWEVLTKLLSSQTDNQVMKKIRQWMTEDRTVTLVSITKNSCSQGEKIGSTLRNWFKSRPTYKWITSCTISLFIYAGTESANMIHIKEVTIEPKERITLSPKPPYENNTKKIECPIDEIVRYYEEDGVPKSLHQTEPNLPPYRSDCTRYIIQRTHLLSEWARSVFISVQLKEKPVSAQNPLHILQTVFASSTPENKRALGNVYPSVNSHLTEGMDWMNLIDILRLTCDSFHQILDHIETTQGRYLISTIGKHVTEVEIQRCILKIMTEKLKLEFHPTGFHHAIQKSFSDDSEGYVSLECRSSCENEFRTVRTYMARGDGIGSVMSVALTPALSISFCGSIHVHGWSRIQFDSVESLTRCCVSSRRCSEFILMLGSLQSDQIMKLEHAMIISGGDEILIPILTELLPTAKTFKKAIESLSKEQRSFAEAFRGMQLAGSTLVIGTVPIQCQLEQILHIPEDSLTKEIELKRKLLDLLITHNIPSDLFSSQKNNNHTTHQKLTQIKENVLSITNMINIEKKIELEEARMKEELELEHELGEEMKFSPLGSQINEESLDMSRTEDQDIALDRIIEQIEKMNELAMSIQEELSNQCCTIETICETRDKKYEPAFDDDVLDSISESLDCNEVNKIFSELNSLAESQNSCLDTISDNIAPAVVITSTPQDDMVVELDVEVNSLSEEATENCFQSVSNLAARLDKELEKNDEGNAVHPTSLRIGSEWKRRVKLFGSGGYQDVSVDDLGEEKDKAKDLLDCLSCSGLYPLLHSQFHIVTSVTHCFDKSIMKTIIQRNHNPIAAVEQTELVVASVVFNKPKNILKQ